MAVRIPNRFSHLISPGLTKRCTGVYYWLLVELAGSASRSPLSPTKSIAMSIVINLPDELERTLAAEAAKAGMTMSDYVADRLSKTAGGTAVGETKERLTGAARVQRWRELGLIGFDPISPTSRPIPGDFAKRASGGRLPEAVGHGTVLNTFNERRYRMFPGLTIARPYER
jgi:hypothetical protein